MRDPSALRRSFAALAGYLPPGDRFERDRRRDAELVAAGYVVIRFTYVMLTRQPQWVATQIRSAVRRWAPALAR